MAFLITASLYNAYRYYAESSFEGTPESDLKARQDFLNVLNKVPVPPTEAIQKGIDFENEIYAMTNKGIESQDPCVREIAEIVKGGYWQQVVQKRVGDYLLYGKADVIKGNKIFDIKYTGHYDTGKFEGSIQHLLYMECTPIEEFEYLVSDRKEVWTESYFKQPDNTQILLGRINTMVNFINKTPEFSQAFEAHWTAKGK